MSKLSTFEKLAQTIHGHAEFLNSIPDDQRYELFGLHEQAIKGDIEGNYPAQSHHEPEKLKWQAWEKHKGLSKEKAMDQYINLAKKLLPEAMYSKSGA